MCVPYCSLRSALLNATRILCMWPVAAHAHIQIRPLPLTLT
jgi:hypothetical protein